MIKEDLQKKTLAILNTKGPVSFNDLCAALKIPRESADSRQLDRALRGLREAGTIRANKQLKRWELVSKTSSVPSSLGLGQGVGLPPGAP
jgi:hypothetical protein